MMAMVLGGRDGVAARGEDHSVRGGVLVCYRSGAGSRHIEYGRFHLLTD